MLRRLLALTLVSVLVPLAATAQSNVAGAAPPMPPQQAPPTADDERPTTDVALPPTDVATDKPGSQPATEIAAEEPEAWIPDRPWEVIDLAIVLDTSGSMDALIETARLRLWEIVTDLTLLEPTPTLRVGLVTYGNSGNARETGWVRIESDLTQDLDAVYDRLFALTSGGGQELVGRVLETALEGLTWTPSEAALKLVFLTGNEPADQDEMVDFREMSDEARRAGILVHAVFCGNAESEDAATWKELAELAEGQFATIDHRVRVERVETPFDEELAELGASLNDTYIPLGEDGAKRKESLAEQDANTRELSPGAAASRAQVKASPLYSSSWDLVDATAGGSELLYEMDESELPADLRAMSFQERELYVEQKRLEREEIRRRIAELAAERRAYLAERTPPAGAGDSVAFDSVVREALREQAEEKGFQVPERADDENEK